MFEQTRRRLVAVESRLDRRSGTVLVAVIVALALVKHGPRMLMSFGDDQLGGEYPEGQFPLVLFGRWLLVARLLQVPNRLVFEILTFCVTVGILCLIAILLFRRLPRTPALVAFAAVALAQLGLVLVSQFGHADQFVILGAALLVLSGDRSWAVWTLGALLIALGNPGQSVVAAAALLLMSFVKGFAEYRIRSVIALGIGLSWLVADTLVTQANQADAIDDWLGPSLFASLVSGPLRIYGMYGALWILVIVFALGASRKQAMLIALSMVVMPLVFVLITGDGTRVGVGTTSLVLLALIVKAAAPVVTWIEQSLGAFPLVLVVVTLTVIPSMNIAGLDLVLPWDWTQHEIRFWFEVLQRG